MNEKMIMTPIQVGNYTFKNRIVMPPMETRLSTQYGDVTQDMVDYYAERARGGAAAIIVENTYVDDIASRSSLSSSGLYNDHLIAGKYKLSEAIKGNGAVAIIQLSHGGLQANAAAVPGQEPLAPSAVPSKVVKRMPRTLTIEEIEGIEDAFVQAARRAKMAGFDGVEIHGAHGYLICSFLSPNTNRREDIYGGNPENRARFALNILKKVRKEVGEKFLMGFRISGSEFVDGGMTIEDATAYGKMIEEYVDYIHVTASTYESQALWMITPMYRPYAPLVDLAAAMKKAVTKCKVITVNSLTPDIAEEVLKNQQADLVAFGRSLIADPQLPNKIRDGRMEDIRPCMRGNEGCISLFNSGCPMRCEVNPQAGHERDFQIFKSGVKKHVVIIGGGMAGMEAARAAALYGHKVTLLEKSSKLGGHFIEASVPDFKKGTKGMLNWLKRQIRQADIDIRMNTEATPELVKQLKPDALIIAVGSEYLLPSIPGIEHTITAKDALLCRELVKEQVLVIGGGLVGSETALALAKDHRQVTILEMQEDIALQNEPMSREALKYELAANGVRIITGAVVTKVRSDGAEYEAAGKTEQISADTIVAAFGLQARTEIAAAFTDLCPEYRIIGDAKEARKLFSCIHEAWYAVRAISGSVT